MTPKNKGKELNVHQQQIKGPYLQTNLVTPRRMSNRVNEVQRELRINSIQT